MPLVGFFWINLSHSSSYKDCFRVKIASDNFHCQVECQFAYCATISHYLSRPFE